MGTVVKMGGQRPEPKPSGEKKAPAAAGEIFGLPQKTVIIGGGVLVAVLAAAGLFFAIGGGGGGGGDYPAFQPESQAGGTSVPADVAGDGGTGPPVGVPAGGGPAVSGGAPAVVVPDGGGEGLGGGAPTASSGGSDLPPGHTLGSPGEDGSVSGGSVSGSSVSVPAGSVGQDGRLDPGDPRTHNLDSGEVAQPRGFPTGPGAR